MQLKQTAKKLFAIQFDLWTKSFLFIYSFDMYETPPAG